MEQQLAKRWLQKCMIVLISSILLILALCFVFDPYFHFHKPFSFISYRLYEERYINDGISRHFDYDAMITGTSMAQNFKTSELDAMFGTQSVKETFSGAGYQEVSQNLERALKRNDGLKTVVWTVDYNGLIRDYDWTQYEDYPVYLYDDNPWNDVEYIFNKSIFYHGVLANLAMTLTGTPSTTFDEYSAWDKETGLQHILQTYDRSNVDDLPSVLDEEEQELVTQTVKENLVNLVSQYPDVTFYLFYTPYSICYWDSLNLEGSMQRQIAAEQIATELLLSCSNVKLYNFFDQYDIICNLDNYRDKEHYSAEINSKILQWIHDGVGLVTWENYKERLAAEQEFYGNYDYESIYE